MSCCVIFVSDLTVVRKIVLHFSNPQLLIELKLNISFLLRWNYKRRNRQKRRQRSTLLFGGRILECCTSLLAARVILRTFFESIQFGRVGVSCGVNQMIIHFSEASCLPGICSSKSVGKHGIWWIPSPKTAATTFASLLSVSSSLGGTIPSTQIVTVIKPAAFQFHDGSCRIRTPESAALLMSYNSSGYVYYDVSEWRELPLSVHV